MTTFETSAFEALVQKSRVVGERVWTMTRRYLRNVVADIAEPFMTVAQKIQEPRRRRQLIKDMELEIRAECLKIQPDAFAFESLSIVFDLKGRFTQTLYVTIVLDGTIPVDDKQKYIATIDQIVARYRKNILLAFCQCNIVKKIYGGM